MIGGLPGNSFVLVEFEQGGGIVEVAALAVGAVGLDLAEHFEAFLELAGEAEVLSNGKQHPARGVGSPKVFEVVDDKDFYRAGSGFQF